MSNVHNPLLLAEVVLVVANYVNPKEAATPSRVCRTWYTVFRPLVWQTCDISDDRLRPGGKPLGQRRPRPKDMVKNAHNIRELICNGSSFSNFEITCSRLKTLRSHNVIYASRPQWWSQLTQLLVQNDQLETVDFDGTREASTLKFWEALVSRPALKYVRMNSVNMSAEHFAIFWNGCRGLRRMELYDINVPCTSEFIEEQLETLPGLEAITISHLAATALLRLCPGLRLFRWQNYDMGGNGQLQMLAFLLERQHFPHLESLQVTRVEDLELATCLGAMDRVKELVIEGSPLGLQSFDALERNFAKLQRISLEYVFPIPSKRILVLLESCPLLKYIRAPKLKASAIVLGKPWVCQDLEEFRVSILVGVSGKTTIRRGSQAVFERLSKLTRLTHLDIGFHYMQDDNSDSDDSDDSDGDILACQGLDLTLESGFSQLSTLKNLEELDFSYTVQDMSAEDVKWIRDNLKKLQVVKGICNRHGEYRDQPQN
ncbi:hypothetical protein BG006_008146 [Podila minutissima]|uniref:F-box domain-containing protein n=1 Tax=Podila minutissima TaxID=64525 RepID=A0A9P5VQB7_9FUNG|nr:hypothetical protein BG006_008146 [Podila minutissima]